MTSSLCYGENRVARQRSPHLQNGEVVASSLLLHLSDKVKRDLHDMRPTTSMEPEYPISPSWIGVEIMRKNRGRW